MKTVIEMAREAGFHVMTDPLFGDAWLAQHHEDNFYHFAALAYAAGAAAEREACHALRQTLPNPHEHCQVSAHAYDMALVAYGAAIRARVNT